MEQKLLNKNFILLIFGQIISLFANTMLRFILPLYILDLTNSPAVFGILLATSTIPTIIFSISGGIIADRCNRKNIMVILDFLSSFIIFIFFFIIKTNFIILGIALLIILLSIIQAFYQPAVQASIKDLSPSNELERANSMISLVNASASILAPILGGIFYTIFNILYIILIISLCFFISALFEMYIKINFIKKNEKINLFNIVKNDFFISFKYIYKDKPVILKLMLLVSSINFFITSMFIVSLPVIIKFDLNLSNNFYGFAQGIIAFGMIIGGIIVGIIGKKLKFKSSFIFLILIPIFYLPIAIVFMFNFPVFFKYTILLIFSVFMMASITIFSIISISFIQRETPNELIGKIMAYSFVICQSSLPLGQLIYGILFKRFINYIPVIIMLSSIVCLSIIISFKKIFKNKI